MSFRRHTRVRRKSRYAEWLLDAFGSDIIEGWALDEPTGAGDFTGFQASKTATINGGVALHQGSLVGGVRGSAEFDGSTGKANAGDDGDFDFGDGVSFSVFAWVKVDESSSSDTGIVTKRSNSSPFVGWTLTLDNSGSGKALVDSGSEAAFVDAGAAITDGQPHFLGMTWDGATLTKYRDGEQAGTSSNSSVGDLSNSISLFVGAAREGINEFFGKVQYPMIFSDVVTSTEAQAMYEQGAEFFDRGRLL